MKRAMFMPCVLLGMAAISARAAEPKPEAKKVEPQPAAVAEAPKEAPAAEKAPAEVTEPVIPERKLVFEEADVELPMKLFEADAKLLEQHYVAVFRITADARGPRSLPGNLDSVYQSAIFRAPGPSFGNVMENTPKERLPSRELVSILTHNARRHVMSRMLDDEEAPDGFRVVEFKVLGPTPEAVTELVVAILQLYDYGLSYPIQRESLRLVQQGEAVLAELRPELKKAEAELARQEEQLEPYREYEDITKESLADLMTQRRLLLVDLAGVEARIAECQKNLHDPRTSAWKEQVETIMIAAQIELVGLRARKEYIDHVVEKGRERLALSSDVFQAKAKRSTLGVRVSRIEDDVEANRSQRKRFEPFPIEGGKITIHPVRWYSPDDYPRSPGDNSRSSDNNPRWWLR